MKKTNWYPCNVKPVRKGVYEVLWIGSVGGMWFNYWNGQYWFYGCYDVDDSANYQTRGLIPQKKQHLAIRWRGVLQ